MGEVNSFLGRIGLNFRESTRLEDRKQIPHRGIIERSLKLLLDILYRYVKRESALSSEDIIKVTRLFALVLPALDREGYGKGSRRDYISSLESLRNSLVSRKKIVSLQDVKEIERILRELEGE